MAKLSRLLLALTLVGAMAATRIPSASAEDWCWNDPIVRINNTIVDVTTLVQGSRATVAAAVQSATYTIHVAPGTSTATLATFGVFPEYVNWVYDGQRSADGSQTVRVDVTFQSSRALPAQLLVYKVAANGAKPQISGQTVTGTTAANATMSASFTVR